MKALELTVYPRRGRETYVLPAPARCLGASAVDRISQQKRLTDAELAADYWGLRAMVDEAQLMHGPLNPEGVRVRGQVDILLRFANLPHYEEAKP